MLLHTHTHTHTHTLHAHIQQTHTHTHTYAYVFSIPLLWPPMLLMLVLYLCIFMRIHQQLRGGGVSGSGSHSYYHKERKLTRSLVFILVLFAVCWLPLHFMNAASFYGVIVPRQAFYVGILLSHANSAINPVVYALKIRKLKSAFKAIWMRHFLCKEGQETKVNINSTISTRNEPNRTL